MIWISSRKNVYRSSPIVIVHLRHRDSYLVTVVQVKQSYRMPPEVEIFLALRKVHDDRRVVLDTKRTRRHRHRLEYSNEFYSSGVESETPKLFRGNVTGNFWSNILLIYELIIYIYVDIFTIIRNFISPPILQSIDTSFLPREKIYFSLSPPPSFSITMRFFLFHRKWKEKLSSRKNIYYKGHHFLQINVIIVNALIHLTSFIVYN